MPQLAVVAVAKFLVVVGVKAAIAKFAATVFVYAASAYLLNKAAKSLANKNRSTGGLSSAEVNYFDTAASVRIAYGRVRTGGMETLPALVSGTDNKYLHKVLTLTGHEIDSFNYVHFDANTIEGSQIGPMAYTSSDGRVLSGTYSGHAFIRRYRGTSTDSVDRLLWDMSSSAFANFRGIGISKLALTFAFNEEIYKAVPEVTATYQGKRCYDPRLDPSPGASPTNPSYIAWTQCPPVAIADYLMADYGGGYASDEIDWTTVVAAANACDATLVTPGGSKPSFTLNGVILATDRFEDNVKAMVDAMIGRIIFADGKWRMYAGAWKTPSFTIQQNDWVSGLSIKFEQGRKKRLNRMHGWFVDPTREWKMMECFPRSNATYLLNDKNERIEAETEQPLCTDEHEMQRKCEMLMNQSRNQIVVAGRLRPQFQDIATWDTGTLVFGGLGWSSKTFRAVALDVNPDGTVDGVFSEEQSTDWNDVISYDSPSIAALPLTNVLKPSEPRNFQAVPQVNGTIMFSWDVPIINPAGNQIEIIRSTNASDASVGTRVWVGVAQPVPLVMPVSLHYYYLRSAAPGSRFSAYVPNTFGTPVITRLEADQTLQQRLCGDAEFEYSEAASLWQTMAVGFGALAAFNQGTQFPAQINNMYVEEANAGGVAVTTYVASGGQYGGYMNVRKSTNTPGAFANLPAVFAANPMRPFGEAYNNEPFGVEYLARIRINTHGWTPSDILKFGMLVSYATPNSLNMRQVTGIWDVTSHAQTVLGQWAIVKGFGVVTPLAEQTAVGTTQPKAVTSFTNLYIRPGMVFNFTGSQGNYDVDYFQATAVGFRNEPIQAGAFNAGSGSVTWEYTMYEFTAMLNAILQMNVSSRIGNVVFPSSSTNRWSDWRQWPVGRTYRLGKSQLNAQINILPSSGMNLYLANRAAVGTVTMPFSTACIAEVQKASNTDFIITGVGLT